MVALDAGGTKLLGGLVTEAGEILARDQRPTPRVDGRSDSGFVALQGLAASLVEQAAGLGHQVRGVGLGIAEYVSGDQLTSAEVFDWDRQPAEILAALVDGPVSVETDVRSAAIAEAASRAPHPGCLLYISWGTGLSSTVVIDGRCHEGRRGEALALGEWLVHPDVDRSWTGNLEQFASGHGMGARFASATGRPATGADVAAAAAAGDPAAEGVLASAARALAAALASLVQVLDPDLVVLGGGIGVNGGRLPDLVAEALPTWLHRPDPPRVERSIAGADAGLLGAAVVGWQKLRR